MLIITTTLELTFALFTVIPFIFYGRFLSWVNFFSKVFKAFAMVFFYGVCLCISLTSSREARPVSRGLQTAGMVAIGVGVFVSYFFMVLKIFVILWTTIKSKCTEEGKDPKDGRSRVEKSREELRDEELLKSVRGLIVYSDVDLDALEVYKRGINDCKMLDDDFDLDNRRKHFQRSKRVKNLSDNKNHFFAFKDAPEEGIGGRGPKPRNFGRRDLSGRGLSWHHMVSLERKKKIEKKRKIRYGREHDLSDRINLNNPDVSENHRGAVNPRNSQPNQIKAKKRFVPMYW